MVQHLASNGQSIEEYALLGVRIHPLTIPQLNSLVASRIGAKQKLIIASQNLHSIYLFHRVESVRSLQEHSVMHVDGMPLILFGRLLGYPLKPDHRVTWVDWLWPLLESAEANNWRVYYLGSTKEVAEKGVSKIRRSFPRLIISWSDGYFDTSSASLENVRRIEAINAAQPDLLIVGMGMPRQEEWILNELESLNATVIATSGAAMEYVTGVVATPPRILGSLSLEWAFRLLENPARFWRRYLIEPWALVPLATRDIWDAVLRRRQRSRNMD